MEMSTVVLQWRPAIHNSCNPLLSVVWAELVVRAMVLITRWLGVVQSQCLLLCLACAVAGAIPHICLQVFRRISVSIWHVMCVYYMSPVQ